MPDRRAYEAVMTGNELNKNQENAIKTCASRVYLIAAGEDRCHCETGVILTIAAVNTCCSLRIKLHFTQESPQCCNGSHH